MSPELIEILANASPDVLKWAAFWHGFWGALPFLVMFFLLTWGTRAAWKYFKANEPTTKG